MDCERACCSGFALRLRSVARRSPEEPEAQQQPPLGEAEKQHEEGPPEWDRDMDVSPEELAELRSQQAEEAEPSGAGSSGLAAQACASGEPSSGSGSPAAGGPSGPCSGSAPAAAAGPRPPAVVPGGGLATPAAGPRPPALVPGVGLATPAEELRQAPRGEVLVRPCCCNLLRIVYGEVLAMRAELGQARADMVRLARRANP